MKNKRSIWVIISLAVVILIVGITGAVILVKSNSPARRFQEQLDLGYKYLEALEYDQAIASFEAAIEIDPHNPEPYMGLIDSYVGMDDFYEISEIYELATVNLNESELEEIVDHASRELRSEIDDMIDDDEIDLAREILEILSDIDPKRADKYEDKLAESIDGCSMGVHDWIEATCTEPKICRICGVTEGESLGHDWIVSQSSDQMICSVCGALGPMIPSTELYELDYLGDYSNFIVYEDSIIIIRDNDYAELEMEFADINGNTRQIQYLYKAECSWSYWFVDWENCDVGEVALVTTSVNMYDNLLSVSFYNKYGDLIQSLSSYMDDDFYPNLEYLKVDKCSDANHYAFSRVDSLTGNIGEVLFYCDIRDGSVVDNQDISLEYDSDEQFSVGEYVIYRYEPAINGYFACTSDYTQYGYLDSDYNPIAMYSDATYFNKSGYALISKEGYTYSIIDSEFNILIEDAIAANDIYYLCDNVFCVELEHGQEVIVIK